MNKITKEECAFIVEKLAQWLDKNNSHHYLYICIYNELKNYQNQLVLIEKQKLKEWINIIPTEFYKQI